MAVSGDGWRQSVVALVTGDGRVLSFIEKRGRTGHKGVFNLDRGRGYFARVKGILPRQERKKKRKMEEAICHDTCAKIHVSSIFQ